PVAVRDFDLGQLVLGQQIGELTYQLRIDAHCALLAGADGVLGLGHLTSCTCSGQRSVTRWPFRPPSTRLLAARDERRRGDWNPGQWGGSARCRRHERWRDGREPWARSGEGRGRAQSE